MKKKKKKKKLESEMRNTKELIISRECLLLEEFLFSRNINDSRLIEPGEELGDSRCG